MDKLNDLTTSTNNFNVLDTLVILNLVTLLMAISPTRSNSSINGFYYTKRLLYNARREYDGPNTQG